MSGVWKWIVDHQLAGWISVSAGSLLAALLFRDGQAAVVAIFGGVFLVVLSLSVNGLLDWWESRKATSQGRAVVAHGQRGATGDGPSDSAAPAQRARWSD